MNFALAVFKPYGMSSSDVVIKCRNALSRAVGKKIKCGHMGTLDPAATGVLLLGFGKAAKLFDHVQKCKKTYLAEFEFGRSTDTFDCEGEITSDDGRLPASVDFFNALKSFEGEISQVPPAYSAVNVNGVRAYKLARKGEEVRLEAKKVTVYSLRTIRIETDGKGGVKSVMLEIVCGSGTYIRSICRDLAEKLGVSGYMTSLRRTECGGYQIREAVFLQDFLADPLSYVRPDDEIVDKLFGISQTDEKTAERLKFGQTVATDLTDGTYGLKCGSELLGIANVKDGYVKLETHLWNTL